MDKLQFVFPLTFPLHFTSMDYTSRLSTGEECNAMHPRKKAGERAQLGERSSINSLWSFRCIDSDGGGSMAVQRPIQRQVSILLCIVT